MQPELVKHISKRDRNLGWVLLSLVAISYFPAAYFVYPLLEPPSNAAEFYLGLSLLGTLSGTVLAVFTWFCLSADSMLRRSALVLFLTSATTALWCLGFVSSLEPGENIWPSLLEPLSAAAFLPMLFFGLLVPLMAFRILSGSVLSSRWEDPPADRNYSLADLMIWIGFAAVLAWSIKSAFQSVEDWRIALRFFGFAFGIAFAFGAGVLVVGSTLWFSNTFAFVASVAVTLFCFLAIGAAAGFWMGPADKTGMLVLLGATGVALLTTTGGLRLLGYRLRRLVSDRN